MRVLRGIISSRFHVAAQNLKTVEKLLLERTGLASMAPGTLNVTFPFDYIVRADTAIEPDEYFTGERLTLQRCRVRGHSMIIMRPDSHELPGGIVAISLARFPKGRDHSIRICFGSSAMISGNSAF